jgi:hypothetical protein
LPARVKPVNDSKSQLYGYQFQCPACNNAHLLPVGEGPGPRWDFNGSLEFPTFSPSLLIRSGHYTSGGTDHCWCKYNEKQIAAGKKPAGFKCTICHSFIVNGQIQFLTDCTHELAGSTVDLAEIPDA